MSNSSLPSEAVPKAEAQSLTARALEAYSDCWLLRAAAAGAGALTGQIPVTAIVDAMFGVWGQGIRQKRTDALIAAIDQELQQLSATAVDRDYLNSEAFYDLLLQVFTRGQQSRHRERVRYFARVLRGSVESETIRDEAEGYLELLSELGPDEFRLGLVLWERFREQPFNLTESERAFTLTERELVSQTHLLGRLEGKGVLERTVEITSRQFSVGLAFAMSQHQPAPWGAPERSHRDNWRVSPYFARLLDYLRDEDSQTAPKEP